VERLYGRADVLARVSRGVERACAGAGRLLLFTGEPGIGKSRLAEQAADEAAGRAAAVAWGRCWEAGGAPAYWPWVQVFRALELEDPFTGAAAQLAAVASEARFALFDRAVRALKQAAARRPLALVLDDLHAADAPSLLLLLLLARELPRSAILVVGAYRAAEARLNPDIATVLTKIAREAEVLPLGRLSPAEVADWVREAARAPDAERADEIYRLTEGHPLFVVETLRLGGERAGGRLPLGLTAVLDEHLAQLAPGTRALLDVAAVLGRDFTAADLAATAGKTPDEAFAALNEAVATSIVVPGADAAGFRFSHVLLRDRLYAELPPSARAALHTRAGDALLARGADTQVAIHHLFEGQSAGQPLAIAEAALAAAVAALGRLAFEDAADLGRRALGLPVAGGLPPRLAIELRLVVAEASIRLGESAAGKQLCVEAAALAEQAGADELLARAALTYGTELASGTIDPQMIALLRKALARLGDGDSLLRARVMVRLAAALTPPPDRSNMGEIVDLARMAMAMARRMGDRHTLLYVLQFSSTVGLLVRDEERFVIIQETVDLARAMGQRLVLLLAMPAYVTALVARGECARAEAALPGYDELLADFHQPLHRLRRLLVDVMLAVVRGDDDRAQAASLEALAIARREESGTAMLLWLIQRMSHAQLYGRPELLVDHIDTLVAMFDAMPSAVPYLSWLLAGLGRRGEAIRRLRELILDPLPTPSANLMDLMGGAEACVLLGDRALGETIYPRLVRAVDRMFWHLGSGSVLGPTARALGDLAGLIGRVPEARGHYDEAIAFCEKMGSPPLVELCRARRAALVEGDAGPAPPTPVQPAAPAASPAVAALTPAAAVELRREGEIWAITGAGGAPVRLRHSKGLGYLQYLIDQPGRQVHVLELAGVEHLTGDAGVVLDARAKAEYRARLDQLGEALAEAERFGDTLRARRIEAEIDALADQLAGAVGLGGRDRRAASDVERTRINVQRRLKDAIDRIAAVNPPLGRYLTAAVKTGTYCVYRPL
jgi:hypothetical protein